MLFIINWFEKLFKRKKKYVNYIRGNETLPEPLSKEEEFRILTNFQAGDELARQTLIEHNLRLVVYIAKKFESSGVNLEDLISIGTLGLIKGVQTFKMDKNIKLATYASRCIENEILMHLRKTNRIRHEVSLDEPLNVDWDGNELLLSDILGTEEDVIYKDLENEAEHKLLIKAINGLSKRERLIVKMRYGFESEDGEEKTQKEVADLLGISQSYISRLEKRILDKLRQAMKNHE